MRSEEVGWSRPRSLSCIAGCMGRGEDAAEAAGRPAMMPRMPTPATAPRPRCTRSLSGSRCFSSANQAGGDATGSRRLPWPGGNP